MQTKMNYDTEPAQPAAQLIHVVFGTPSQNCRRYGICKLENRTEIPPQYIAQNNTCFAEIKIDRKTEIQFLRQTDDTSNGVEVF